MLFTDGVIEKILKGEVHIKDVAESGTWHIKVRGEHVIDSTLWFDGDKYITYDLDDNNINLHQLSMDRPEVKFN